MTDRFLLLRLNVSSTRVLLTLLERQVLRKAPVHVKMLVMYHIHPCIPSIPPFVNAVSTLDAVATAKCFLQK